MINSIKYFEENSISIFEKLETEFMKDPTKVAENIKDLKEELCKLGVRIIQEWFEDLDQLLQDSVVRKNHYYVEQHSDKTLISSLGEVRFKKTLFTSKETGKSVYLLDQVMGMDKRERFTEDAVENILEEAVQSSYRRGGDAASVSSTVSKQTVMKKIHALQFPKEETKGLEKKVVDYLYIEADEDHISLQFQDKKGDLEANENGWKNNCLISKVVYVHEGLEPENIIDIGTEKERKTKRWKLIHPHYFCRTSGSQKNEDFWEEIFQWISAHYDLFKVKKIYLNADGGGWIQAGPKRIAGITYVLDEFHLRKYITRLTSHMKDSIEDAQKELYDAIRTDKQEEFIKITERLKDALNDEVREAGNKRINEGKDYILNNWVAARVRLKHKEGVIGSSTEGHVYHVISTRMSTRPMGWSKTGADKMSRLRAYYLNGGDMLELVRYQKQGFPMAAGAEGESLITPAEIMRSEKSRHGMIGKYMDSISHSISDEKKKLAPFRAILGSRIQ